MSATARSTSVFTRNTIHSLKGKHGRSLKGRHGAPINGIMHLGSAVVVAVAAAMAGGGARGGGGRRGGGGEICCLGSFAVRVSLLYEF